MTWRMVDFVCSNLDCHTRGRKQEHLVRKDDMDLTQCPSCKTIMEPQIGTPKVAIWTAGEY